MRPAGLGRAPAQQAAASSRHHSRTASSGRRGVCVRLHRYMLSLHRERSHTYIGNDFGINRDGSTAGPWARRRDTQQHLFHGPAGRELPVAAMDEIINQPAAIDRLQRHFIGPLNRCLGRPGFAPFRKAVRATVRRTRLARRVALISWRLRKRDDFRRAWPASARTAPASGGRPSPTPGRGSQCKKILMRP